MIFVDEFNPPTSRVLLLQMRASTLPERIMEVENHLFVEENGPRGPFLQLSTCMIFQDYSGSVRNESCVFERSITSFCRLKQTSPERR